ncbi:MAG: bifunctional riboflavin kinase/FAD synthetase [Candidatus Acidiferrales bacterium]
MALEVLRSPEEWQARYGARGAAKKRSALTIGCFDGLHLGHQQVLARVVARAREGGLLPGVVTFDPHPLRVLRPAEAPPLIATIEQRLEGFATMGIEAALVLKFDAELARISAEEFLRGILAEKLAMAAILIGPNFRFGHRQEGDVPMLEASAHRFGYSVELLQPVRLGSDVVSSTAIRSAVAEGRVGEAARLLGHPFSLTGPVRAGARRGRAILFPTLNLVAEQELLPKRGVYVTETRVGNRTYGSATNVGVRPTVDGGNLSIESHLFDFAETLVESRIEIRFLERLRDERKFASVEELRRQIAQDLEAAKEFLKALPRR